MGPHYCGLRIVACYLATYVVLLGVVVAVATSNCLSLCQDDCWGVVRYNHLRARYNHFTPRAQPFDFTVYDFMIPIPMGTLYNFT